MSLRHAARRLALSGPSSSCPGCSTPLPVLSSKAVGATTIQRRHKWSVDFFKNWRKSGKNQNKADSAGPGQDLDDPKKRQQFLGRFYDQKLDDNIFGDEIERDQKQKTSAAGGEDDGGAAAETGIPDEKPTPERRAAVNDPDPRGRVRWQRKKVMQMVRRNGRVTRDERLRMTERQLLHKSEFLPTSVKKLVMLSRQIAGKTVDDAIAQMRWSKKKMAAEVRYYLEEARDLAVAQRGMGLGRASGGGSEGLSQQQQQQKTQVRKIQTAEGKWIDVEDPTRMYVAQSWVGRGPWRGKEIDYKGRGRMGIIQHPATSLTIVLKEEKTRIREYDEREAKKAKKGPWVHLPNRPVYGQRPYYSW